MADNVYKYSDFYGFFTKYSLLDDYGFFNGIKSRISHKILPEYVSEKSFEKFVLTKKWKHTDAANLITILNFDTIDSVQLKRDLFQSIIALSSKITAIGLDKNIKYKLESLDIDMTIFPKLSQKCAQLEYEGIGELEKLILNVSEVFQHFRLNKYKFGTSIQLTYKTKLATKYLDRLLLLVQLYNDYKNPKIWTQLTREYIIEYKKHRSFLKYIEYHFDLVLLQVVEYTSLKGEKYISENRKEYFSFLKKSMLGGGLISLFAFFKVYFDSTNSTIFNNALFFSLNYATCFVLVKSLGGIIATKQPAMTASTISKHVDSDNDLTVDNAKCVIELVKNTLRSQFISFVGNVAVAIPVSILIFYLWHRYADKVLIDAKKVDILINEISILNPINLYYAAIAGVFLAIAGFISGNVNNKFVYGKIKHRIKDIFLFKKVFSPLALNKSSEWLERNFGAFVGNVSLGFFLGSAFLVGAFTIIPFDIRHIAFSASYLGALALVKGISTKILLQCFAGVCMIGLFNFLVSFFITLSITLKTRGITAKQIKEAIAGLIREFFKSPISFFYFTNSTKSKA